MELRHLRYFAAVADEGSVSEAARVRLHTAQPSLSRQLRDLENELGVELFERHVRGMTLTRDGRAFLGHVRQILKQIDDSVATIRESSLVMRVGLIPGIEPLILPVLTRLARQHIAGIEIVATSRASADLIQQVHEGILEFAFVQPPQEVSDIRFQPIGRHRMAAFMRRDHPCADKVALTATDIAEHGYIAINLRIGSVLRNAIESWSEKHGLKSTHSGAHIASGFSLILATNGIALMPEYAAQVMPATLVMRPLRDGPDPQTIAIAWRAFSSQRLHALVSFLTQNWPPAS